MGLFSLVWLLLFLGLGWLVHKSHWTWSGQRKKARTTKVVGIFHPNAHEFGGPARVMWAMVANLVNDPRVKRVVVMSRKLPANHLQQVRLYFGIHIRSEKLVYVHLNEQRYFWTQPAYWDYCSRFFQMVFGGLLVFDAIFNRGRLEVLIDTQGFPFFPLVARMIHPHSKIVGYIHQPRLSRGPLSRLRKSHPWLLAPIAYEKFLLWAYRYASHFGFSQIWCNSKYTQSRMNAILGERLPSEVIYPPVNLAAFRKNRPPAPLRTPPRLVTLGQFRSKKNHKLQIEIFKQVLQMEPHAELHICGSTRNLEDEIWVGSLKEHAMELGIQDNVFFHVNMQLSDLVSLFHNAHIGLHTTPQESFGISLVEMLSAGLVVISHKSGAALEVLRTGRGFLADSTLDYVSTIHRMLDRLKRNELFDTLTQVRVDVDESFDDDSTFGVKIAKLLFST